MLCSPWRSRVAAQHKQAWKQQKERMKGQLRITVLDTSPTTRKVLEVILHRQGHQVACFDDPLAALRALSRHGAAGAAAHRRSGIRLPPSEESRPASKGYC